ncbi:hypothetical protein BJ508DRAFT_335984 [Ascobolus immersus RN42]|uniref:Uncharacterized protein n=1 Tax=Ascobolus immersus RN42 TaxID=1160509 RepID=A0A3N4HAC7_ASCIM|nr:hypothetical protein BJ508DRAFT_335984 [Ascobolus immersus RN42]
MPTFATLPLEIHLIIGSYFWDDQPEAQLENDELLLESYIYPEPAPSPFHSLAGTSHHIRKLYNPLTHGKSYFRDYLASNLALGVTYWSEDAGWEPSSTILNPMGLINAGVRRIILGGPIYIKQFLRVWESLYTTAIRVSKDSWGFRPLHYFKISAQIVAALIWAVCDMFCWLQEMGGFINEADARASLEYLLSSEDEVIKAILAGCYRLMISKDYGPKNCLMPLWLRGKELKDLNMMVILHGCLTPYSRPNLLSSLHVGCARMLVAAGLEEKFELWKDALKSAVRGMHAEFVTYALGQILFNQPISRSNPLYYDIKELLAPERLCTFPRRGIYPFITADEWDMAVEHDDYSLLARRQLEMLQVHWSIFGNDKANKRMAFIRHHVAYAIEDTSFPYHFDQLMAARNDPERRKPWEIARFGEFKAVSIWKYIITLLEAAFQPKTLALRIKDFTFKDTLLRDAGSYISRAENHEDAKQLALQIVDLLKGWDFVKISEALKTSNSTLEEDAVHDLGLAKKLQKKDGSRKDPQKAVRGFAEGGNRSPIRRKAKQRRKKRKGKKST